MDCLHSVTYRIHNAAVAMNASDAAAPCTLSHAGRVACGPFVRPPHPVNGRPIRATDVVPPLVQHTALISDAGGAYAAVAPPPRPRLEQRRARERGRCGAQSRALAGPAWEPSRRPPYPGLMRIWLDLPDALGDRVFTRNPPSCQLRQAANTREGR